MNALNIIFVVLIVLAFVAYFYFKTKQFRSSLPIAKKWYKSKAGVALAAFIVLFGLNSALLFPDTLTFVVVAVFLLIGIGTGFENYKRAKHYGQFVEEEYALNKK